jgi:hypothetical protein
MTFVTEIFRKMDTYRHKKSYLVNVFVFQDWIRWTNYTGETSQRHLCDGRKVTRGSTKYRPSWKGRPNKVSTKNPKNFKLNPKHFKLKSQNF